MGGGRKGKGRAATAALFLAVMLAACACVLLISDDNEVEAAGTSVTVDITGKNITEIMAAIAAEFSGGADEVVVTGTTVTGEVEHLYLNVPTGATIKWDANLTSSALVDIGIFGSGTFISTSGSSLTAGGIWGDGSGLVVTLNGTLAFTYAGTYWGFGAYGGSKMTINGDLTLNGEYEVTAELDSELNINGNLTAGSDSKIWANGGKITIKGNAAAPGGACADDGGLVVIHGTLTVSNTDEFVWFYGSSGWYSVAKGDYNQTRVGPISGGFEYSDGGTPESFVYTEVPLSPGPGNNTLLIVGAVVAVVAVIGLVGYFVYKRKP